MSDDTLSMLADAAAGFAKPDLARVRKLRGSEPGYEPERWSQMAEQGWFSILVSENDGGLGLGIDASCVVAQKLGYALFPEPFAASGVMAPLALARSGNARLKETLLGEVASGEKVATLAWQGISGEIGFDKLGVTATPSGDGVVLRGEARFVAVPAADVFIVAARRQGGIALYCVARDAAGLGVAREACADGSAQARLKFDEVRVPADAELANPDQGAALLREVLDAGILVTAAELAGMMDRMHEMTMEYLRTRQQFGKAIGSFQILQHRSVDLWIQKQLTQAAVNAAAQSFGSASPDARSAAASGAKSRASDAALLMGKQCIQMHGAIGVTDEYDLGLYVNRALTLSAWLGNGAAHRRRFGELAPETND